MGYKSDMSVWDEYQAMQWEVDEPKNEELESLIREMKPLGFTKSYQVSQYIVKNKVGYKYPTLSGVLRVHSKNSEWDFNGGIDPRYYREVCTALDLDDKNTRTWVKKYTPWSEMENRRW